MTTKLFTRLWLLALAMITSTVGFAQDKPEMADLMRSNGKIYMVMTISLYHTHRFVFIRDVGRQENVDEKITELLI